MSNNNQITEWEVGMRVRRVYSASPGAEPGRTVIVTGLGNAMFLGHYESDPDRYEWAYRYEYDGHGGWEQVPETHTITITTETRKPMPDEWFIGAPQAPQLDIDLPQGRRDTLMIHKAGQQINFSEPRHVITSWKVD